MSAGTTNIVQKPEAQAVAEIVEKSRVPRLVQLGADANGTERAVIAVPTPSGWELNEVKPLLAPYLVAPERRYGTAELEDLASFVAHANRFRDNDSALFATLDPPKLTSVLDYHRLGAGSAPRFGEHRGVYEFPLSKEWQAWTASNGKAFEMAGFAAFLEDRILDVADPSTATEGALRIAETLGATFAAPQRLLELSRGLSVNVGARVTNATNLGTGESSMQFVTQHTDERGAPLKIPSAFLVTMPVFESGALYQLAARLRYRVRDGAVAWSYELCRADRALADAVREACETAKTDTGLPLFYGSPES